MRQAVVVQRPDGVEDAADLFRTLGSASRLHLLMLIADEPHQVGQLASAAGMTQPLVSQHLRVLRQAGLVAVTREGLEATYRLADRHVGHVIEDAVAHVREDHSDDPEKEHDHVQH